MDVIFEKVISVRCRDTGQTAELLTQTTGEPGWVFLVMQEINSVLEKNLPGMKEQFQVRFSDKVFSEWSLKK